MIFIKPSKKQELSKDNAKKRCKAVLETERSETRVEPHKNFEDFNIQIKKSTVR